VQKYFSTHRAYFSGFDEVVLMMDQDSPGSSAAMSASQVLALPYGRVKLATFPLKDASEMLQADRVDELLNAMWRAVPYRPTGFVDIGDIRDDILKGPVLGEPWPWKALTQSTFGRRRGEIYTLGAGTGIGKTSAWLQVGAEIIRTGSKVGFILFENSHRDAGLRIASAAAGKPFYVPDSCWTQEQLQSALDSLTGKCLLYDTANADWESCASMIRYWAGAEDCHHIVLDHLSAFSAQEEDDRKALDSVMAQLAKLTQELQLQVFLITHLKRPFGQSHEEGGRVRLDQFRGSNAIAMWSHFCFGMERNQQADDKSEQHHSLLRVLKDRNTGAGTGDVIRLTWDKATGRLVERDPAEGF
jgi:twinkle protein